MTEVADFTFETPWWRRLFPGRRPRSHGRDFSELVWVHQLWRQSLAAGTLDGGLEQRYRDALDAFEEEHGRVVNAYWCSTEASGAVLTVKPAGIVGRLFRRQPHYRFHRLTDWSTKNKAAIASLLHECDALAVKTSEILRGTTQRITMELIMSSASHILGLADDASAHDRPQERRRALTHARKALAQTRHYYEEVALREAQIIYFWGMVAGFVVVAAVGGLGVWAFVDTSEKLAYATVLAGAMGAIVSVLMRVTKNTFVVDADLGRSSLRRLGSFRPVIGAVSGVAVYLAYESGLLTVMPSGSGGGGHRHFFFALLAFLAGFSERFAKDVLDAAADTVSTAVEQRDAMMEVAPEEEPPAAVAPA